MLAALPFIVGAGGVTLAMQACSCPMWLLGAILLTARADGPGARLLAVCAAPAPEARRVQTRSLSGSLLIPIPPPLLLCPSFSSL